MWNVQSWSGRHPLMFIRRGWKITLVRKYLLQFDCTLPCSASAALSPAVLQCVLARSPTVACGDRRAGASLDSLLRFLCRYFTLGQIFSKIPTHTLVYLEINIFKNIFLCHIFIKQQTIIYRVVQYQGTMWWVACSMYTVTVGNSICYAFKDSHCIKK